MTGEFQYSFSQLESCHWTALVVHNIFSRTLFLRVTELHGIYAIGASTARTVASNSSGLPLPQAVSEESLHKLARENPINVATGALLFGSIFFVMGHGGSFELAVINRAMVLGHTITSLVPLRRKGGDSGDNADAEAISQTRRVYVASLAFAAVGLFVGGFLVIALHSEQKASVISLACLLGAGTTAPFGAQVGSYLDKVSRAGEQELLWGKDHHGMHLLAALRKRGFCSLVLARLVAMLACLPCCRVLWSEGEGVGAEYRRRPSPRLAATWLITIMGAVAWGLFGALFDGLASTATNSTLSLPGLDGAVLQSLAGYDQPSDNINNATGGSGAGWMQSAARLVVDAHEASGSHFRQLRKERDGSFETEIVQVLLLALASLFWDVIVVSYHWFKAPHPKFRLRYARRLSIYTHIAAGTAEVVLSVVAFCIYCDVEALDLVERGACLEPQTGNVNNWSHAEWRMCVVYALVFCATIHTLTAAFQTPQVFGMQAVMVPAYTAVVIWKAVSALRLLLSPHSLWLLLQLFFTHHIYVWCRAMHVVFEETGTFADTRYSTSIMFAGLICGPIALGPSANYAVICVVALFGILRLPYLRPDAQVEWRMERRSNMLLNAPFSETLRALAGGRQHSGRGVKQLHQLADPVHLQRLSAVTAAAGDSIGGQGAGTASGMGSSDRQRARVIFDAIDVNRDGILRRDEVLALLLTWGIPHGEAVRCFDKYDVADTGELSFEAFFVHWEPVWRFQLERIEEAVTHFHRFSTSENFAKSWSHP
eukprot:COSAG05_NODE_456_length_9625_cov_17.941214_5_plen_768_part_00